MKAQFEISNLFRSDGKMIVQVISDEKPEEYQWRETVSTLEDVYLYAFEGCKR